MKIFKLTILFALILSAGLSLKAFPQDEKVRVLEPITVTSSRIEKDTAFKSTKNSDYIEVESDAPSPHTFTGLLEHKSYVDMRSRGPEDVQSDVSIRGATFEQTLVLIDGIRMNDPQTGHHNMDIPLTIFDLEAIDVAYGPTSSIYGSSGLGGTVNFMQKKPGDKFGFSLMSAMGGYDYYIGAASMDLPVGEVIRNRASFEGSRSGGYRPEAEFDIMTTGVNSEIDLTDKLGANFLFGYQKKDFGANNFYSDLFPNQEEHTDTRLLIVKGEYDDDVVRISPKFYFRRHWDKYFLDRNRRTWYMNVHTTYVYGGEIDLLVRTPLGKVLIGGGLGDESITSTNLGNHLRAKRALFFEYDPGFEKLLLNVSGRLDHYSDFGWQFSPNFGAGYLVTPQFKLRSSIGRAFRAPSFTDLYYTSPANMGNPDLKPEKAWSYDAGAEYDDGKIKLGETIFYRRTEDMIDWTRAGPLAPWTAENIGRFDVIGLETLLSVNVDKYIVESFIKNMALRYEYLEAPDKKGITSKYVMEFLKHNLGFSFVHKLPFGAEQSWSLRFQKRIGDSGYFLADTYLSKTVKHKALEVEVFVQAENLFDVDYSTQGAIPMPGRWIKGGAKARF